jgi:predicted DNA binding CopG/RHH family protein
MKTKFKITDDYANKFLDDAEQESWEKGKLGQDPTHTKVVSKEETQKFLNAKGTLPTSIRLPKEMVHDLRTLAKENGLSYQTYLKMILTIHLNKEKLKKSA